MTKIPTSIYQATKDIIVKNRRITVILIYLFQVAIANYLAFLLRFDFALDQQYFLLFKSYFAILLIIRLLFYLQAGMYKDLWRYSSVSDLIKIVKSTTFSSIIFLIVVRYIFGDVSYPRSVYILDWGLLVMISGGSRLLIRIFREYMGSQISGKRTLIIGAGNAGEMIVRDMKHNPKFTYEPIGFIDDNRYKKGLSIHGVPIFGPRSMLGQVIEEQKPEEILISLPSASLEVIRDTYDICKPYNIPIKTLPKLLDIIDGKVSVSQIRSLSLEDLLEREPVRTDIEEVRDYISGKSVLVTGAGGSIGSELCRQIFKYNPSNLVMFDRYENSLFDIDLELNGQKSDAANQKSMVHAVIGDILDNYVLERLFSEHAPSIVFHAAAHKHVPLMEHNPLEAVKNNIFGTKNILEATSRHNAESFVMVSTDKAVNPASIMGATKRVAEFLTMNMNGISSTRYTTVRFGNVLGSNGSVVDIFKKQLKKGGPLTVTHPDIKRYFMLIPEAVQLVLIAAASGKGGDLFVLDMGEQIKLTDFAENLIRLSGFIPYEEINIEFSGLRPGEKLYEELFNDSERSVPSTHDKLRIAIPEKIPDMSELEQHIEKLRNIISKNTVKDVIPLIKRIVPNYQVP